MPSRHKRHRVPSIPMHRRLADVCLLVEGAYPYVAGGVSSWVHDLIRTQRELTFHVVTLMPHPRGLKVRYEMPNNVLSLSHVYLSHLAQGAPRLRHSERFFAELSDALLALQQGSGASEIVRLLRLVGEVGAEQLGSRILLDSNSAWEAILGMYNRSMPQSSFSNYFWSWRSMLSSLFAALLAPLPKATVFHSLSTGYAGLLAARAKLMERRAVMLTEHGIYTNERRIELMQAQWLSGGTPFNLSLQEASLELRDLWTGLFTSYAQACYAACDRIVTLYEGNQRLQLRDGADPEKLLIIPNGIAFQRFAQLVQQRTPHPPTVALIGRVVPIKDVKTFIRAVAQLREGVPNMRVWILGPTDEDPVYFQECKDLVKEFECSALIDFKGRVKLEEYLAQIDVVALTSLSEAQPLVILEAGAAAVPLVCTDVGSCREMILGRPSESPRFGPGGAITGLASPAATAAALRELLTNPARREECGRNLQQRVQSHYNKVRIDNLYSELYRSLMQAEPARTAAQGMPWLA